MSADVEGSFTGFLDDAEPLAGGGFGVADGLPLVLPLAASSVCALFFLRAILWQKTQGKRSNGAIYVVRRRVDECINKFRGLGCQDRGAFLCERPPACSNLTSVSQFAYSCAFFMLQAVKGPFSTVPGILSSILSLTTHDPYHLLSRLFRFPLEALKPQPKPSQMPQLLAERSPFIREYTYTSSCSPIQISAYPTSPKFFLASAANPKALRLALERQQARDLSMSNEPYGGPPKLTRRYEQMKSDY
jgi:hypothetical protein